MGSWEAAVCALIFCSYRFLFGHLLVLQCSVMSIAVEEIYQPCNKGEYKTLHRRTYNSETSEGLHLDLALYERTKAYRMDAMIDKLTGATFIFQIVVMIVLGIAGNIWKDTEARKCPLRARYLISSGTETHIHIFFMQHWYVLYPEAGISVQFELLYVELLNAINTVSLDATRFVAVMAICNNVIAIKSGGSICAEWVDICYVCIDPYAYEWVDVNPMESLHSSMKLGINESLRLANIVPGVFRRAPKDIKFKGLTYVLWKLALHKHI
nr:hypothetical protein [Tanacetum cinerariifolium]